MTPFSHFAFFTIARDASVIALANGLLMLAFSSEPQVAFTIGATVSLIFSIFLIVRVSSLTERRFLRSEQWRALSDEERPTGEGGRQWAREELKGVLLRFAKNAAGVAGVLYGSALAISIS